MITISSIQLALLGTLLSLISLLVGYVFARQTYSREKESFPLEELVQDIPVESHEALFKGSECETQPVSLEERVKSLEDFSTALKEGFGLEDNNYTFVEVRNGGYIYRVPLPDTNNRPNKPVVPRFISNK